MSATTVPTADELPIRVVEWRAIKGKGPLRGFARIRLGSTLAFEVSIFQGNDHLWVGMPGRPLLDAVGVGLRDDKGKQRYSPVMEWKSREASNRFSEAVIAAITREYPDAFDASEAAVDEAAEKPVAQHQERPPALNGTRQHRGKVLMGEGDPVPF